MCSVCGCGEAKKGIQGHGYWTDHGLNHDHPPEESGRRRLLRVEQDLLAQNNRYAETNRRYLQERGIFALNLVSSPGSGKTTLLTATIQALDGEPALAVIEGDQQTSFDTERIRATGVSAVQINTGKGCHLDAHRVGHALQQLAMPEAGVLFIENVGNLVCPAGFDLGETHKVLILSVTEGEDKPLKYPDMFAAAGLMILNKIDLLPYLDFDAERCIDYARRINPAIEVMQLSARSGEGMTDWLDWLRRGHRRAVVGRKKLVRPGA